MRLKKAHQKDGYYRVVIDRCTGCGAKLTDYDLERGLFETSSGLLCLSCVENTQRKSHEKKTNKSVLIEASASIWHKTKVVLKKQISKRVVLVLPSAVFAVGLLLILTVSYLQGETKHGEKKMVVRQREPLPTVNSKEKAAEDVIVRLLEKRETEKKETVKEEGRSESSGSEEKEEKKEKPSGGFVIPTTDERVDAEFGSRDKFQEEKSQREEKSPDRQTNDKTNRGGAEKSRRAEAARETMERVPRPVAKENLKPAESQAKKESFQEEVDKAIGKGVKWLLSQQNFDGSFQGFYNRRNPMGNTAIALYALLSAGVRPDSEEIRKGFEYLSGLPLDKTYDVSLLLLAIDSYFTKPLQKRLPNKWRTEVENEFKRGPASLRGLAEKAAKWLVEAQLENGMWTYTRQPSTGWAAGGDMSNAQFALLGLDAACRLGISIPAKTFIKSIEVLLFQVQQEKGEEYKNPFYVPAAEESLSGIRKREEERKSGKGRTEVVQGRGEKMFVRGFGYTPTFRKEPYLTMTAAGLAGLVVCKAALEKAGVYPRYAEKGDAGIRDAAAYIASNFSVSRYMERGRLSGARGWGDYYHLFSLERAGVMAMVERFGERCWYEEGAKAILASQMEDGSWDRELVDTSFAILFLSRAVVAPADDTIYTGEGLLPGNKGK